MSTTPQNEVFDIICDELVVMTPDEPFTDRMVAESIVGMLTAAGYAITRPMSTNPWLGLDEVQTLALCQLCSEFDVHPCDDEQVAGLAAALLDHHVRLTRAAAARRELEAAVVAPIIHLLDRLARILDRMPWVR